MRGKAMLKSQMPPRLPIRSRTPFHREAETTYYINAPVSPRCHLCIFIRGHFAGDPLRLRLAPVVNGINYKSLI